MIVPDVNLLIYAHDETTMNHAAARDWWRSALSEGEPIGVPAIVVTAFVRLSTHPAVMATPISVRQARAAVEAWFDAGSVRLLSPTENTFRRFFDLLAEVGVAANLTTDAMIAALAIEHAGTVYSNDRDFERFGGLRWENPLD